MHSRTQAHVFHLQTKSYAEHMALNAYYDGIVPIVDAIAEAYQGKHGIIENIKSFSIDQYSSKEDVIKYFEELGKVTESIQKKFDDTYIQNLVDTATELIYSTKYKIEMLG